MPIVAAVLLALLLVAGMARCYREGRHFLWGRAAVLTAAVYAWGAWAGSWPWPAPRTLLDYVTDWLGG